MAKHGWSAAVFGTVFIFACGLQGVQSKPPHIVFILADDYGFNDVGYHNPRIKTPNIDSLAADGVRLENYYVQPICTPTRSQLFSGRYQIHTGLQHGIIWPSQPNALPKNDTTIASKLKETGYSTHMVGKWHIGFYKREFIPTQRGFDSFFGYLTGGEDYYSHINGQGFPMKKEFNNLNGYDLRRNEEVAKDAAGNYSTFLFTDEAVKIISNHEADKPLFLFVAYQAVHSPLEVPKQYTEQYKNITDYNRRIYAGMVSCMDEGVGNITQALQMHGLWDDTVFFFSTDNGGQIYAGGNNWPLRGWKGSLWEGGMRGVGLVYSKLLSQPGQINTELIHVTDWFPTIVNLSGGSVDGMPLDGYNVWETLSKGEPSPRKEILHNIDPTDVWMHFNDPYKFCRQAAIRVGDWKLLKGCPGNGSWVPPQESFYPIKHSPNAFDNVNSTFLFNIREDPEERNELSGVYPEMVSYLMMRLKEYNATAVPVRFPEPDPASKPELHGYAWTPWVQDNRKIMHKSAANMADIVDHLKVEPKNKLDA